MVVTDNKVEQQIQEGLRSIKTLQESESEKQLANIKGKIDQLENEVLTRAQGNVITSASALVLPSYLKFHGDVKEQPWSFISKLESYFTINNIPDRLKLHVVEQAMSAKAHHWWTSLVPEPTSYKEWKDKF